MKSAIKTEWWHPPHYLPTIEEQRRAHDRMIEDMLDRDDWLSDRPRHERRVAFKNVYNRQGWPEYADPEDLKRLGFEND